MGEKLIYTRTKTIQEDKVSGFCPGCMHGTVMKLIGEVIDELGIIEKTACVLGIGCCGLQMDYMAYDNITSPHGRACAVATGIKRTSPDTFVFTYQGDGDLASIGLAETMSAANRGENISVIVLVGSLRQYEARINTIVGRLETVSVQLEELDVEKAVRTANDVTEALDAEKISEIVDTLNDVAKDLGSVDWAKLAGNVNDVAGDAQTNLADAEVALFFIALSAAAGIVCSL